MNGPVSVPPPNSQGTRIATASTFTQTFRINLSTQPRVVANTHDDTNSGEGYRTPLMVQPVAKPSVCFYSGANGYHIHPCINLHHPCCASSYAFGANAGAHSGTRQPPHSLLWQAAHPTRFWPCRAWEGSIARRCGSRTWPESLSSQRRCKITYVYSSNHASTANRSQRRHTVATRGKNEFRLGRFV